MGELSIDASVVATGIEGFLRQQVDTLRREGVILGLSGGIDSAVVATLAARALGPERVLALIMPERDSHPQSQRDALHLVRMLRVRYQVIVLTHLLSAIGIYRKVPLWLVPFRGLRERVVALYHRRYARELPESPFMAGLLGTRGIEGGWLRRGYAYVRIKHRLRMILLYYHAELENLLVLGCCNRSEVMTGFFVQYGDSAADAVPLGPLYKTQVRELATYLGIPPAIVAKPPSPDLLPGLTDEGALGLSYEVLDRILWRLEAGIAPEQVAVALTVSPRTVEYVAELMRRSQHMRLLPPAPALVLPPFLADGPGPSVATTEERY